MAGGNRRDRRLAAAQARRAAPGRSSATFTGAKLDPLQSALAMVEAGRLREAFDHFVLATAARPGDRGALSAFGHFLVSNVPGRPHPDVDVVFIAALNEAWVRPDTLAVLCARYLSAKAETAFDTPLPGEAAKMLDAPDVRRLLDDALLTALLRATPAATPALDIFIARCRGAALAAALAGDDLTWLLPFLSALAERQAHSHFALTLPASEADQAHRANEAEGLAALRGLINSDLDRPGWAARVALLGCYELLQDLPASPPRDPLLAHVFAAHVEEPRREAEIARALVPLTSSNATNEPVRRQYEVHPYPMWVREPIGAPVALPRSVVAALRRRRNKTVANVLVAGCGTGQHAIAAVDHWPGAKVLAIDISRASLAHGIRKAEALGVKNVEFGLADLLAIGELGRRFDVIESMGVLHHLADPAAGLASLVDVLEPDGLMLLGLYSRAARRRLDTGRRLAGPEIPETAEEIRSFRARALTELDAPEVLFSPDFYSIGGCRDLVFHAREHAYDLEQIAAMLAGAGLAMLAIETPAQAAAVIGPVPTEQDFAGWVAAEGSHPTLFGGLYQFWAKRA